MIAYLGTGLLGAGFVEKFLERGKSVHVWNRTIEKARPLEALGAKVFSDPAGAIAGADRIHLTLADDASVDAVLEPLAGKIGKGTLVIDHTTTAPTPTGERVKRWAERGVAYAHAPAFMGPANARNATGLMVVSGDPALRARVKPLLEPMTGKVVELGDDPAQAAAYKLFGNMMYVIVVSGLADVLRFASSLGITPEQAQAFFEREFQVSCDLGDRGNAMAHGDFTTNWELAMARKDVRLMLEEGARHGARFDVLPLIASVFDRYIEGGHGREDVGVVALATPGKRNPDR